MPDILSPRQLSLNVQLLDDATFENFLVDFFSDEGSLQHRELPHIKDWLANWSAEKNFKVQEPFVYLWGAEGSGRSHLLQACCHFAASGGSLVQYLPLMELANHSPEGVLENLQYTNLICLDDIHEIAGIADWENRLFHLYNQIRDNGGRLLIAGNAPPRELSINLPDLVSRMSWGPVFQLPKLDDEDKRQLLVFRAGQRGLEMNREVANYLLNRVERDLTNLICLLGRLDKASLENKRMLTIPFIKQQLESY